MLEISDSYSPFVGQWHLCYYIPGNSTDALSKHVISFKNGDGDCIKCWASWVIDELQKKGITFDYVIRSLGSSEIVASSNKPLDYIGRRIEQNLKFPYTPSLVFKSRTTMKFASNRLNKAQREAELEGVYKLSDNCPDLLGKKVLILDDVATSGTTSKAIIKEIKAKYPTCQGYLFTLARTNYQTDANEGISLKFFE